MNKTVPAILQNKKKLKVKKQKEELTQADLQRLKIILTQDIASHQYTILNLKSEISKAWNYCEKGNPGSKSWFKYMNGQKNRLRKIQESMKNLEQIQKRIKSMLSN